MIICVYIIQKTKGLLYICAVSSRDICVLFWSLSGYIKLKKIRRIGTKVCLSRIANHRRPIFTTIHNTVNNNKNLMTLPSIHLGFLCRENEDANWGGQTQHTQQLSLSHSLHPSISRWWDGCVGDVPLLSRRRRGAQQGGIWFLSYYEEKTKPTGKNFSLYA